MSVYGSVDQWITSEMNAGVDAANRKPLLLSPSANLGRGEGVRGGERTTKKRKDR
jgi:hypothetical protein